MGRPSDYSPELEDRICEALADGKSLSAICREEWAPHRDTVYQWMGQNKAFSDRYARAVEDRAEKLAEEILEIADDSSLDIGFKEAEDGSGKSATPFVDHEHIQRSKLRVDSRKWIASKLFPKKYGDKVQNEHTGADGAPIEFSVNVTFIKPNGPG